MVVGNVKKKYQFRIHLNVYTLKITKLLQFLNLKT